MVKKPENFMKMHVNYMKMHIIKKSKILSVYITGNGRKILNIINKLK